MSNVTSRPIDRRQETPPVRAEPSELAGAPVAPAQTQTVPLQEVALRPELAGLERSLQAVLGESQQRSLAAEQTATLAAEARQLTQSFSAPKAKPAAALSSPELDAGPGYRSMMDVLKAQELPAIIRSEQKTELQKVVINALCGGETKRYEAALSRQSQATQQAVKATSPLVDTLFTTHVAPSLKGSATKKGESNSTAPTDSMQTDSATGPASLRTETASEAFAAVEIPSGDVLKLERALQPQQSVIESAIKSGVDIDSLIQLVMMESQKSATEDLRNVILELQESNKKKQAMRAMVAAMKDQERKAEQLLRQRYEERSSLAKDDPRFIDKKSVSFESFSANQALRAMDGSLDDGSIKVAVSPNEKHFAPVPTPVLDNKGNAFAQIIVDQAQTLHVNPQSLSDLRDAYRSRSDLQQQHKSFESYLFHLGLKANSPEAGAANEAKLAAALREHQAFLAEQAATKQKTETPKEQPKTAPVVDKALPQQEFEALLNATRAAGSGPAVMSYDAVDQDLKRKIDALGGKLDPIQRNQLDQMMIDVLFASAHWYQNKSAISRAGPAATFALFDLLEGRPPSINPADRQAAHQYVMLRLAEAQKDARRASRRGADDDSWAPEGSFIRQHLFTLNDGNTLAKWGPIDDTEDHDADEFGFMADHLQGAINSLAGAKAAPPPPPTPPAPGPGANPPGQFDFPSDWEAKAEEQKKQQAAAQERSALKMESAKVGSMLGLQPGVVKIADGFFEAMKPKDRTPKQPPRVDVPELSMADLTSAKEALQSKMDTLGDMTEELSLRLQMFQERRQKLIEILSNVMKKNADTSSGIIGNIK